MEYNSSKSRYCTYVYTGSRKLGTCFQKKERLPQNVGYAVCGPGNFHDVSTWHVPLISKDKVSSPSAKRVTRLSSYKRHSPEADLA